MKVLHFFKTYWPDSFGGVERTIHAIAESTASHGVETEVLSLSRLPDKNTLRLDGHIARKARLDFELASTGFSREVFGKFGALAGKADLVHYHFPWPLMDMAHFRARHAKPTVVTYHSDIVKQRILKLLYAPLMHRFLGSVDRIVATSPNYLATSPVLGNFRNKTLVIPIGLNEKDYPKPSAEQIAAWRARFPAPFFVFVGVLRYYKGIDILIEAARATRADIVIVGEGPMQARLKKKAEHLDASNVHFVGPVSDPDKVALLQLSEGLVSPANQRSEAFGLALLEAAMLGRPMISTELGTGTSYINLNRKTGLVVPANNAPALAAAMNETISSPNVSAEWGIAARDRFQTLFTADRMGRAYAELYHDLLHSA